jgi:aminoglycoside phosphotransferase family enzyme
VDAQEAWLTAEADLLKLRARRVVDAHGDLRPEHICLEQEPVVIDCLEFDRSLRLLDPASELCFLALECQRLGMGWIGRHLLDAYVDLTGDNVPATLMGFYQSYHALVRAAVAAWHLDDCPEDTSRWQERAGWYLRAGHDLLGAATGR